MNSEGYKTITIDKRNIRTHRVIWVYVYGDINGVIDHIDHDKANNTISNLRVCSCADNSKNKKLLSNSKNGIFGVYKSRGKFRSRIRSEGKLISLGTFTSFLDAVCARKSAEIKYNFHVNHGK